MIKELEQQMLKPYLAHRKLSVIIMFLILFPRPLVLPKVSSVLLSIWV